MTTRSAFLAPKSVPAGRVLGPNGTLESSRPFLGTRPDRRIDERDEATTRRTGRVRFLTIDIEDSDITPQW